MNMVRIILTQLDNSCDSHMTYDNQHAYGRCCIVIIFEGYSIQILIVQLCGWGFNLCCGCGHSTGVKK